MNIKKGEEMDQTAMYFRIPKHLKAKLEASAKAKALSSAAMLRLIVIKHFTNDARTEA